MSTPTVVSSGQISAHDFDWYPFAGPERNETKREHKHKHKPIDRVAPLLARARHQICYQIKAITFLGRPS